MTQAELLSLVKKEIAEWNQVALLQALGVLGLGIACALAFGISPPTRERVLISGIGVTANRVIVGLFVAGLISAGAVLLRRYLVSAPERWATVVALRDDPRQIVWVYHTAIYRSGVHTKTEIWVGFLGGHLEGFMASRGRDAQILDGLRALCPQATHGYSEEIAARFAQGALRLQT